jgi:surface protein
MFDGCNSLTYLNLSNFITNNLENMDYTFANNNELVYLNLFNLNENHIKSMNNIFYETQDNMVFCINVTNALNINKLIIDKGCSYVDCSLNFNESRKLIYVRTNTLFNL